MKRGTIAALVALAVTATACSKSEAPQKTAPPPSVVVAPVIQRDQPISSEWIGTTAGDVDAEIRPRVDGYLLRRVYQEGSLVHAGDVLFEIDTRQPQAQLEQSEANLEQAKANLARTERDVARFEPLAAQKAISQEELDNARSAERAARATVGSLNAAVDQSKLNRSWTRVTSPITGIAGVAQEQVGDLVSPQTVLATVSKVDPIRVIYQIGEQEYLVYAKALAANPSAAKQELELVLADGSTYPQKGHVFFSGRDVDAKTGTIAMVGLFPNPGNLLRPGQFAKVRAVTRTAKSAILVPQRAVNELQGTFQVAVVGNDDKAVVKVVKTGERVGDLWVIDEGLEQGDRVVVEGFTRLKNGAPVKPQLATDEPATGTAAGTATTGGKD